MAVRWPLLLFMTGFCSMIYELAFAQLLTGLLGGAFTRFATTLGVYVAGLGLGSALFKENTEQDDAKLLLRAELGLVGIGLLSPAAFVVLHSLLSSATQSVAEFNVLLIVTHAVIFATGFVSGLELPLLTSLAKHHRADSDPFVIGWDYLGMFAATLSFPLVLFPMFGLVTSFYVATSINLFAAVLTLLLIKKPSRVMTLGLIAFFVANVSALVFSPSIQSWLTLVYAPAR